MTRSKSVQDKDTVSNAGRNGNTSRPGLYKNTVVWSNKEMPHYSGSGETELGGTESWSRRETNVSTSSGYSKPLGCRYCDKKFIHGGHRNEHERAVHLKQKPYVCKFCVKTFGHFHNKDTHEKSVHLKERVSCRFCDRTFSHISGRTRHEKACHKQLRHHHACSY